MARPAYREITDDAERVRLVVRFRLLGAVQAARLHGCARQTVYAHVARVEGNARLAALVDAELAAVAERHRHQTDTLVSALLDFLLGQVKRGRLTVAEASRALEAARAIGAPTPTATTAPTAGGQLGLPAYLTTPRADAAADPSATTP